MSPLSRRALFFLEGLLILGCISGCSGGTEFQVSGEDRYTIRVIDIIGEKTRDRLISLVPVSQIKRNCDGRQCYLLRRIPAGQDFPDSNQGVRGDIIKNEALKKLGYIPYHMPLSGWPSAYVLLPILKPKQ